MRKVLPIYDDEMLNGKPTTQSLSAVCDATGKSLYGIFFLEDVVVVVVFVLGFVYVFLAFVGMCGTETSRFQPAQRRRYRHVLCVRLTGEAILLALCLTVRVER